MPQISLKGKIRISLFACFMLVACGAPQQPIVVERPQINNDVPKPEAQTASVISDNQSETDNKKKDEAPILNADDTQESDNNTDLVGSIIWQLEQADKSQTQTQETPPSFEDLIPTGQDPSLAKEALDAAFGMLKTAEDKRPPSSYSAPPKKKITCA